MECPICHVKLMVDERKQRGIIKTRCMKCGREFNIKRGRLEQKKNKRVKKIINKKVTIRGRSSDTDRMVKEQERIMKHHSEIQQQLAMVRRMNAMRQQKKP